VDPRSTHRYASKLRPPLAHRRLYICRRRLGRRFSSWRQQFCVKGNVQTYNGVGFDGENTYGGYSARSW
jgi:hypothetical protein